MSHKEISHLGCEVEFEFIARVVGAGLVGAHLVGLHGVVQDACDLQHLFHRVAVCLVQTLQVHFDMSLCRLSRHTHYSSYKCPVLTFTFSLEDGKKKTQLVIKCDKKKKVFKYIPVCISVEFGLLDKGR